MASLVKLLLDRHPEDKAIIMLRDHFDKAVMDGDCKEFICTKTGCKDRTNE